MSVIYLMIPAALVLAGIGVAAFVFAARSGQFDDLDTPALRAVFDDDDDLSTPSQHQSEPHEQKTVTSDHADQHPSQ